MSNLQISLFQGNVNRIVYRNVHFANYLSTKSCLNGMFIVTLIVDICKSIYIC